MSQMNKLSFEYDEQRDVLIVEGNKYAADLFRAFAGTLGDGTLLPLGQLFRLVRRENETIVLERQ
jgi:hypothetical protein